jgi:hypothetical protein
MDLDFFDSPKEVSSWEEQSGAGSEFMKIKRHITKMISL